MPAAVPAENFPTSQRKAPDGNNDVWKCRSSRQGKDFLTCIKCTRDCISNLHNPDQISRGGPFLPKKWVLGDHFSTENFGPGDQNSGDSSTPGRLAYPVHHQTMHKRFMRAFTSGLDYSVASLCWSGALLKHQGNPNFWLQEDYHCGIRLHWAFFPGLA